MQGGLRCILHRLRRGSVKITSFSVPAKDRVADPLRAAPAIPRAHYRRAISYLKSGTALVSRRIEALEEPTGLVRNDRRKLFRDIEVVPGSDLADLHADQPSQPA